jgi:DNA-binding response OmpR family regulator
MPRVLVVDDDPAVLQLLRVNFELDGYDVVAASNGEDALEAAAAGGIDCVVCDWMMPGMDGLEVVRRLKSQSDTAKVPVVMVSAKTQRTDVSEGRAAGVDEYVTKPFDPQDLLDAVGRVLKSK